FAYPNSYQKGAIYFQKHKLIYTTYCGVHLFLNEFLKSAEKLIAEKYNYKNWITNQLYTPFDNHHIQEKDILP
ncbi:hypothetical protein, partial [Roseburia sp. 1XD42-69]|uniref:hypothetical protein n=1 Tax=Roseburia sp. 1XD42-69 TaxID=2320088 RepID=UPI000ECA74B7